MWRSAWVILCACAALTAGDEQRPCNCSGLIRRTADCSHRGRSTFDKRDLCAGLTTKVDLSRNAFSAFPPALGAHVVHVNISHNRLTALPRAPPLNAKTHSLDVSSNRIAAAAGDELRDLSALHVLAVGGNRLASLRFLPSPCALRRLSAPGNLLHEVPVDLDRCKQLRALDLSDNPIGVLTQGSFVALGNLEHVHLARARLQQLEAGCFDGPEKLKHLDLAHNRLSTLPPALFAPLTNLTRLDLDNNTLSSLSKDAFIGLSNLQILRLVNNNITQLPGGVFSPLKNLEYLWLDGNRLKTLPAHVFAGMAELHSVGLSHNRLAALPARAFANLPRLRYVDVSANGLTELPSDLLSGVEHLHALDLHGNRLRALPRGLFGGVRSVVALNLSHNSLWNLDGRALEGLGRVERLDVQNNVLRALPEYEPSVWPGVGRAFLGGNFIDAVTEAQLRSWLGSGHRRRVLALGARPPLRALAPLRWALDDPEVLAATRDGCACGFLKQRYAEVSFCTEARCPGDVANWTEAVRAVGPAPARD